MTEQKIEIPLSKSKLTVILIGCIAFVICGILLVNNPSKYMNLIYNNPIIIYVSGLASILFFGLCGGLIIHKLLDNKPGVIIDNLGITDNSSGISGGHILWTDIDDIFIGTVYRQKLILFKFKNPQAYIDKQTNICKQKIMALNYKIYDTPLSMTAKGLQISFDELYKAIIEKFNANRQS